MIKFDEENQKKYLIKYWSKNSNEIIPIGNLSIKAENLIKKISESINDKEKEITGIPLQLKILSEIYLEEYKENKEINLILLFEKFIDYFSKKF